MTSNGFTVVVASAALAAAATNLFPVLNFTAGASFTGVAVESEGMFELIPAFDMESLAKADFLCTFE